MSPRYEFVDHTADVVVRAYGTTLAKAFGSAARALFDIISGDGEIRNDKDVSFSVESGDLQGLLVGFLSRLIYIHETENLILGEFEVRIEGDTKLAAVCRGEKFDSARHGQGMHVKAAAYHMMEIHEGQIGKECYVQVLFDV